MDRKEFLITVWKKGIKPILIAGIIFFCGKFLYNVFAESGTERIMTILIVGSGLLMLTAYLMKQLFKSLADKINAILPETIKLWLRIIDKLFDYISPIILGMIVYHFWKEKWMIAAVILGIILIQRTKEIITEEKQAATMVKKS